MLYKCLMDCKEINKNNLYDKQHRRKKSKMDKDSRDHSNNYNHYATRHSWNKLYNLLLDMALLTLCNTFI